MSVRFAQRAATARASEVRELLKLTQRPEVISFAGGLPAPESFPVAGLRAAMERVLGEQACRALQYSTTEGEPGLRSWIAERLKTVHGASVVSADVLVTSGSQQGLDLTGKVFLDEGDIVLCESPTYLAAISAFRAYGARLEAVDTDDEGMLPDDLERRLGAADRVKLIYVIPDFQNPTGRTWSLSRRRALLELAARYGVPLLEDCPYAEIRFEGEAMPSLLSLGGGATVIHAGTFSKTLCPGLRLGYLVAPPAVLERYVLLKQSADLHTSTLTQLVAAEYLSSGELDGNLVRVRELYRRRRDAMVRALEAEMPEGVSFTRPRGGLFLWVTLPAELSARDVLRRALERDVAFVPGGSFFPSSESESFMRLNFSCMPEERITDGVRRLAEVVREALAGARGTGRPALALAS